MSAALLLIPNVGGEEAPRARPPPAVVTVSRLWCLLFPRAARVLHEAAPAPWPEALGAPAETPAFAWLGDARGAVAWLNTPAAAASAAAEGRPLAGPAPEIVQAVHDKAFAQRSGEALGLEPAALRGLVARFDPGELHDADAALRAIERRLADWPAWTQGRFTLKPRLGTSGRGRIGGTRGRVDAASLRAALPRLARRGGALLEPWLQRHADFSVQLHVASDGALTLLGILEQQLSRAGAIRGHRGAIDPRLRVVAESRWDERLVEAATAVARAAHAEGFHGPCGVDAFCFEGPHGPELRPVVEFNARFTVGTVALGLLRRARDCVTTRLGLAAGERLAFRFLLDAPREHRLGNDAGLLTIPLGREAETLRPALLVARDPARLAAHLGT